MSTDVSPRSGRPDEVPPRSPPTSNAGSAQPVEGASGQCASCGAPLHGPYCAQCGQSAAETERPLRALLADGLEDLLDVDVRIVRTLRLLVRAPGRLTASYLAGQRAPYTPPLRLFALSSFLLFLALGLQTRLSSGDWVIPADAPNVRMAESELSMVESAVLGFLEGAASATSASADEKPRLDRSGAALRSAAQRVVDWMSLAVFLLVPVHALVLKGLYPDRYYIAHLVFSLHLYSLGFLLFLVVIALDVVGIDEQGYIRGNAFIVVVSAYTLRAMRRVYSDSWRHAVSRFIALLFGYLLVLALAFGIVSSMLIST